jgi:hypothetical protein
VNIVLNRKQPSSRITAMVTRSDANGRSVMRCSSRDHTYTGLKIDCGFDAQAVECTSSHCPARPRQMSHSLQRLIDDIAVIDEPLDKSDRRHLAYQRGAEADLVEPNDA